MSGAKFPASLLQFFMRIANSDADDSPSSINTRLPAEWSVTQNSAANTAQTLTKAGEVGKKHRVTSVDVFISGAAAGSDITVTLQDGATAKWVGKIGNAAASGSRAGFSVPSGVEMTAGNAANLVVTAGGASVVTTANMTGYTV